MRAARLAQPSTVASFSGHTLRHLVQPTANLPADRLRQLKGSRYITQHTAFLGNLPSRCVTLTGGYSRDIMRRKTSYECTKAAFQESVNSSWELHACCRVASEKARHMHAQNPTAMKNALAEVQQKHMHVRSDPENAVIIQVNGTPYAFEAVLPKFECKNIDGACLSPKPYWPSAGLVACSQGSITLASHGTTQWFTDVLLEGCLPLIISGCSFTGIDMILLKILSFQVVSRFF